MPDRMFLIPGGAPLFVEFKRENEKPSAIQWHRIHELRELGYRAEWADNYDDAVGHITSAMGAARRAEESS